MLQKLKSSWVFALVLGVTMLQGGVAFGQEAFTVPPELSASTIQAATLAVVGPAIAVLIGLGSAFTVAWCVYRILTRKVTRFARG